jgi:type IV fimbrial biogenesis protein FimT
MKIGSVNGFTALELMVAMTVIAILLSAGVPAFRDYTWNQRMKAAMDTLMSDLKLARGKAIGLNTRTVICPAANADDCSGQSSWQTGWIIFADLNKDRHRQSGEPLIRQADATDQLAISSPDSRSYVRFYPNGSAAGSNVSILFCDSRGAAHAGAITVSNSGRIRSRTDGVPSSEICP